VFPSIENRRVIVTQFERALPASEYFQLEQVAQGVYAAIVPEGSAAQGNAGIVDLGNRTLVFDTFCILQAARELREAAEELTGRPVDYVVNSHWHADHVYGNQVFSSHTDVFATARTRDLIEATKDDLVQQKVQVPSRLASLEAQLKTESDESKRQALVEEVNWLRPFAACLPELELRLPNQVFEGRITFYGADRLAELVALPGHTEGDAVLYLPQEQVAFLGDLLFVNCHLWLGHGQPSEWIWALGQIASLDLKTFVPGHGPMGSVEDLTLARAYIKELVKMAQKVIQAGGTVEHAASKAIPAPYEHWEWAEGFEMNMRFLYERLSK
jgi:glyoxylase-like metal-dependent hydrolase (beta-lactamase superfamily II)